jgi:hypothetical protein
MWSTGRVCCSPQKTLPIYSISWTLLLSASPNRAVRVSEGEKMVYRYYAFHRFEISSVVVEPLVFFRVRHEALVKYQGASGFDVADDGSVSCRGEWGLTRSTWRLGNELLATANRCFDFLPSHLPIESFTRTKSAVTGEVLFYRIAIL